VDAESAPMLIHPEAVYIQDGQEYFVHSLSLEEEKAMVRRTDVDYFTRPETDSDLTVADVVDSERRDLWSRNLGEVRVKWKVSGYKKIKYYTHENLGSGLLSLPESEIMTTAFWVEPEDLLASLHPDLARAPYESWKGLIDLLMNVSSLFIMADRRDLTGLPKILGPTSDLPSLFIYDNHAGGVGYSRKIYLLFDEILVAAGKTLEACPCSYGCPSCIGPSSREDSRAKKTARLMLDVLSLPGT
jgi:DEAD/DEAH box helicase domain-containing protein